MKYANSKTLASFVVLGGALVARADVLLDTYAGAAPGFQSNGWSIATTQFIDRPFSVVGSFNLTSIEVPLGNFNSSTGIYNVSINSDNAGVPGTSLESFNVNVTTGVGVVQSYLLNSGLNPMLTTGTYYVVVTTTDGTLSGGWGWNNASNNGAQQFSTDSGATWTNFTNVDVAVRVIGSPSTVPEPASLAVLGVGSLVLIRRRAKK